jgi:carboxyl-terminal processing protease
MRKVKVLLVVLLLPLGFVGGYLVGTRFGDNSAQLSSSQKASAQNVSQLQQKIIEELQTHYYKPVDVAKLGLAGIDGLLASLKDPWTEYLTPQELQQFTELTQGKYSGVGASLEKKDKKLLITAVFDGSPAQKAGLKPGDQIVAVDGRLTADLSLQSSIASIKGKAGAPVTLQIVPAAGGAPRSVTMVRRQIDIPLTTVKMLTIGGRKVAYIELSQFSSGAGAQVAADLRKGTRDGATAVIFDLRDNGGGLLSEAVDVASDFIASGPIVSTQGIHSPKEVLKAEGGHVTSLPVVLLVNGFTASASEIVTGALQDYHRAFVIGTRTFGKGLVQNIVTLPGGAALKLTTAMYLTPDGRDINKRGIAPDEVVKDDTKAPGDEQLRAALQYLAAH